MANILATTSANIFYKARCNAAKHNEQLSSREGAADIMSVDRGRLYRIESGLTMPYPEEAHLMADLYNAPELRNYYCKNCCPLGQSVPQVDADSLDRIVVKALATLKKMDGTKESLLDITEDGVVTESEKPALEQIMKTLDEVVAVAYNLRAWIEKNNKGGAD